MFLQLGLALRVYDTLHGNQRDTAQQPQPRTRNSGCGKFHTRDVRAIVRNEGPREFCEDQKTRRREAGNEIEDRYWIGNEIILNKWYKLIKQKYV